MKRFTAMALAAMLTGCGADPAHRALREAEVACKLPEGMIRYLSSSDERQPKYAPATKAPPWVLIANLGWSRVNTSNCVTQFKPSGGYRIEQSDSIYS
jgi:hypothetical protein